MKRLIFCSLIIAAVLQGCSKEKSFETPSGGSGGNNGGGNGNGGGGNTTTDTYQPMTKDSYWKYDQTGDLPQVYTLTATGTKQPSNGIDFYLFKSAQQAGTVDGYFGIKDHSYYTKTPALGPNGTVIDLIMLYLNDTASAGFTMQHSAGSVNGFDIKMPLKIIARGLTETVKGKTYNDVIHSQVLLQYDLPVFGLTTFVTYDYYVAKNVGIIKIEAIGDDLFGGGAESLVELTEYTIK
jgi:hypothetical protein